MNTKKKGLTSFLSTLHGGEGMDAGQGVESTQFERWRDDYDPDCPTELLVDVEEIAAYEFNYTAIQKWLPWVEVNV